MNLPASPRTAGPFFALTLTLTALLQTPVLLAHLGLIATPVESLMGLAALGIFSPLVAAMVVVRFEPNGDGVRGLFRRMKLGPVAPKWYAIALFTPGAIVALGGIGAQSLGYDVPLFYPPENAQRIVALFLVPFVEEVGWRGLALPRLGRQMGALRASLLLGLIWGIWHVPMLIVSGSPLWAVPIFVGLMIPGSIVFTWIFQHTNGSLLLAIITHMGTHLSNPHQLLGRDLTPAIVQAVAYSLVAIALVVLDRSSFGPSGRELS